MSNDRVFDPDRSLLDCYRTRIARFADSIVCYDTGSAELLAPLVGQSRTFVAPNTLNMDELEQHRADLEAEGRSRVRTRLGWGSDEVVVLFVGRLERDRGVPQLLETLDVLGRDRPARLVVIGDGPEMPALASAHTEKNRVIELHGAVHDVSVTSSILFASDVLLAPGRLGLVVNHAFSFGLPIVSVRPPGMARYHGPEASHLSNGVNAVLAERDAGSLATAIQTVLDSRSRFSRAALETAWRDLSVDRMLTGLVAAIEHASAEAQERNSRRSHLHGGPCSS
jgi:glycosyltransferase involved in cell wall biosynthesis